MARPDSWFRFYNGAVDNPKVQRLPDAMFKAWVNLLCIASKNGGVLPATADIAFTLRTTEQKVVLILAGLEGKGLFDRDETGGVTPHDWNDHQFKSDVSTDRVKRFRKRGRNVSETANETDHSRAETEKKTLPIGSERTRQPKGTRLAADWKPSENNFANAEKLNLTRDETLRLAEQFCRYFHGPDASKPVKKDWDGAFDNWVARDAAKVVANRARGHKPGGNQGYRGSVTAARDSILAKAGVRPASDLNGDNEIRTEGGSWAGGNRESDSGFGTVIDADEWQRSAGSFDGVEGAHSTAIGSNDAGHGNSTGGLPEAGDGIPGGRGETCPENTARGEPLVAGVEGTQGAIGEPQQPQADDADGLEIPSFLKRTA